MVLINDCSSSPHSWPIEVCDSMDSILDLVEVVVPVNFKHGPGQILELVHMFVEHRVVMVEVNIVLGPH